MPQAIDYQSPALARGLLWSFAILMPAYWLVYFIGGGPPFPGTRMTAWKPPPT